LRKPNGIGLMSWSSLTKILLIFATVCYFWHSYWHNTMDFSFYGPRLKFPAANFILKYAYINSFFLFVICSAFLLASAVISAAELKSRIIEFSFLAISALLAVGAISLVTRPQLGYWRRRNVR
jgi:hypothetical protein